MAQEPIDDWRPGQSTAKKEATRLKLKDAIKSFSDLPDPRKPELTRPEQPRTPPAYSFKEPVVNSTHVKWKPIDQVAARVVQPAKWYNQPPQPPPKMSKQHIDQREIGPSNQRELQPNQFENREGRIRTKRMLTEDGHVEEMMPEGDVIPLAVEDHEHRVNKEIKNLESLEGRARELYDSISFILRSTAEPMEEVHKQLARHLNELREKRFGLEAETRLIMNQLKDVRQFFLESNYEEQIDRLRDFVTVCERLQALKESGFLDTVADTMIRLANQ